MASMEYQVIAVVKLSFSKLAKNNHLLIDVIQLMVIKNSQLAVRGTIIMNYLIIYCVANDINVPNNILHQTFVDQAFYPSFADNLSAVKDYILRKVISSIHIPVDDMSMIGVGWLVPYL